MATRNKPTKTQTSRTTQAKGTRVGAKKRKRARGKKR